ncbi:DUF6895 family protein [Actinosynnema sp. CS-041913]|uniref:DUF6895 family protein n=1 Tax=Actinosynnema sp. CS-041913 TaxID=3239917 RepID=UPI003D8C74F2
MDLRQVHETGARALAWTDSHREGFRPDRPEGGLARLKAVGELALTAGVLLQEGAAGARQATCARRLLDFAWHDLLDSGGVLHRLQHDEPSSSVPLELYAPFHDGGYRNPPIEDTLRSTRPLVEAAAVSLPPARRLGVVAAAHRLGLASDADLAAAGRDTWLGHLPPPWSIDRSTTYDAAHTVFHLTGWGGRPDALPAEVVDYLRWWLPAWLEECVHQRAWDLLGGLLAADACLPEPALPEEGWARLCAAQTPDGAVPAEDGDLDRVHHATLMTVLAATLATSRALTALLPGKP